MVRIALCGNIGLEGGDLQAVLLSCAQDAQVGPVDLTEFASPLDLVDSVSHPKSDGPIDLVLLAADVPGMAGLDVVRDIRRAGSKVRIVLFSNNAGHALDALGMEVGGFLPNPALEQDLARTLDRIFARIAEFHGESVLLKLRDRPRRILFSQLVYAETQGHDQLLHLSDGAEYSLRCTSRALFDLLQHDARFFKAGSSYVINLHHVRSVGSDGVVVLSSGMTVNVPVRLRKSLEAALLAL